MLLLFSWLFVTAVVIVLWTAGMYWLGNAGDPTAAGAVVFLWMIGLPVCLIVSTLVTWVLRHCGLT